MTESPDFRKMSVADLRTLAETLDIENVSQMKKNELIEAINEIAKAEDNKNSKAEVATSGKVDSLKEKRKRKRVVKAASEEIEKEQKIVGC